MTFAFGKNDEPLDLSQGGDKPSLNNPAVKQPTVPAAPKPLTTPPAATPVRQAPPVPSLPPRTVAPSQPVTSTPAAQPVAPRVPHTVAPTQQPVQQQPVEQTYVPQEVEQPYQAQETFVPYQQYTQPQQPAPAQQVQQASPEVQMVDRKGRPIKPKEKKPLFPAKAKKKSSFSGDRKKILWVRILVFGVLGLLVLAGIGSFLPKASGLTASDGPLILSKVRENLNVTNFPRTAGEGMALGFSETYLNYSPDTLEARTKALSNYVNSKVLNNIDIRPATDEEIAAAKSNTSGAAATTDGTAAPGTTDAESNPAPTSNAPVSKTDVQKVTDGPYLVGSTMFKGGTAAVFTTKTQINGNTWLYLQIPMYYDTKQGSLSVSGSPTFINPIAVADNVPSTENTPTWTEDQKVEEAIKPSMINYMKAWAASDTATLQRLTVKDGGTDKATPATLQGLDGTVQLINLDKLSVEFKNPPASDATDEEKAAYHKRYAQVTVNWLEPSSGLTYSQSYRLVIEYVNNDWFIQDIQNVTALVDRNNPNPSDTSGQ